MIQSVHEAGRLQEQTYGEYQSCSRCGQHLVYQAYTQTAPREFWPVGQHVQCQDYPCSCIFMETDKPVSCVAR